MLIRQTLLYLPAQLIGPLSQFIAAVVWTHWLPPAQYGVLTFLVASQDLAYTICLLWWSQFTVRFLGTLKEDAALLRFQQNENLVLLVAALLQTGIVTFAILAIGQKLSPALFGFTLVFFISRTISHHLIERARAVGKIGAYTFGQTFGSVVGFGFAFLIVSTLSPSAEAALAGLAAAQVLGLAWLWYQLQIPLALPFAQWPQLRQSLLFGLPLVAAGVIGWVSLNGIRVIVEAARGTEEVGLIAVGWGLGQRLASVMAMLVTAAAFPLAVKRLQNGVKADGLAQLVSNGALLLVFVVPATFGIIMLSKDATQLLIAEPFRATTLVVLPLAAVAGAVRNIRIHFADQVFLLFERTQYVAYINLTEAVLVVAFCGIGLYAGGLTGATLGCLVGSGIGAVLSFGLAYRMFGLRFPFAHAARILGASALMALALAHGIWNHWSGHLSVKLTAEIAVGALVYALWMGLLYPHPFAEAWHLVSKRLLRAIQPAGAK
ncbi:MAG: polysaccharide biosynthesis C-terminal domain-containing protein [Hyphomicrobiales bacterium]|nr:polysaccharide biosynthesis C-terminal domain-containing protein [Hyphomicrobiales bacterium]MDE2115606.1 polysaccharide biosynthesis C-terminal domain-containing protein [Hyphomicrobiales bacterium]